MVKENAQVMFELDKIEGEKKSKCEQSKLSTDQSIQILKGVKAKYRA